MKILVFSDSHLKIPFEPKKYEFLVSIISQADHVIINGDFWDGYFLTFDQFINSPWKQLFPLLKEKKTVYVYGNHDSSAFTDSRVNLFSDIQTMRHELENGGKTFIFEHGNRLYRTPDERIKSKKVLKFNSNLMNTLEKRIIRRLGPKNLMKLLKGKNNSIKKKLAKELKPHEYFVCGHTHCAEYDPEKRFVNSGFIKHGIAQYLFIENGDVIQKYHHYEELGRRKNSNS